jgi:AAA15 family ATPase/GTPase
MIRKLQIRNFKSIKAADLNCKRVNVFIGEPNTGKSNVLESIALLHLFADRYKTYREDDISLMLRISQWNQLFYDQDLSQPLSVTADKTKVELRCNNKKRIDVYIDKDRVESLNPDLLYVSGENLQNLPSVKFALYRFRGRNEFTSREANFIAPPDGPNMIEVIRSRKELMEALQSLLSKLNLNLVLDITGRTIRLETTTPVGEGVRETLALPYSMLSESLQRIIFYTAIVLGNKNMTMAFEVPDHMYPPHVKKLAELIAHDKDRNNQYFLTTYNPYFFMSLIEKTPKDELSIFYTFLLEGRETKVRPLTDEQIEEILDVDVDVFFNLEAL